MTRSNRADHALGLKTLGLKIKLQAIAVGGHDWFFHKATRPIADVGQKLFTAEPGDFRSVPGS